MGIGDLQLIAPIGEIINDIQNHVNGARNILAAGHAVLACGGTVQSDRPLKQEPDAEQSAVTH